MARSKTTFQKGVSGNPGGRPKKDAPKPLTDALRLELHREAKDPSDGVKRENRQIIARAMIRKAREEADNPTINTILDRTEGKVSANFGEGDGEFNLLEFIHRSYALEAERKAAALKVIEHKPILEATVVSEPEPSE
jgi:Family of unknown function (DUF5681)